MKGLTLDAGALIGLDNQSARMHALLDTARAEGLQVRIPAPVLAQVFRDGRRQAALSRLIKLRLTEVVPFEQHEARAAGVLLGLSDRSDVVDAAVVVCARRHHDTVVTSDPADMTALDPSLRLMIL
ncbi:MAG: twitching motility protein PilT [Frankiaceae bacterium]|nr:twitching motility protein PilT [Frankiaceae bacterium]